ncbi:hypothetical protein ACFYNM_30245 [Streptomyces spororaveus]|uniref:hypothetical protein n=1 Tax=Streptomyces spororaveus TaxID=284039 RepID=UPI0036AD3DE7
MQLSPRGRTVTWEHRELGGVRDRRDQPCHLRRAGHRPVDVNAEQPGHPTFEGAPDLLTQPVDTHMRAVGRCTGAHLPMFTATTDNTPRARLGSLAWAERARGRHL